jgi:hypothetical protein
MRADKPRQYNPTGDAAAPIGSDETVEALKTGPIGALVMTSVAVGLLVIGGMTFYFLLFMPRAPIG